MAPVRLIRPFTVFALFVTVLNHPAMAAGTVATLLKANDIASGAAYDRQRKEGEQQFKDAQAEAQKINDAAKPEQPQWIKDEQKKWEEAMKNAGTLRTDWEQAQIATNMARVTGKPAAEVEELQKKSLAAWNAYCPAIYSKEYCES